MKPKNMSLIVGLVLGLSLAAGGFVVAQNTNSDPEGTTGPTNLQVELSLVDEQDTVYRTWRVGYEPASVWRVMTANVEPLSIDDDVTAIDGGRTPALSSKMVAKWTASGLTTPISSEATVMIENLKKPDGSNPLAQKKLDVSKDGGSVTYDFPKWASGRDLLCGKNAKIYHTVGGNAKDVDGKTVTAADHAYSEMTITCQSGSIGVQLTVYPFSAIRTDGGETRIVQMQPVNLGIV